MASQLSNERTLVMFDAVAAGLVECIRLAQSDIEESEQQQRALKTVSVQSMQCCCSRHNSNASGGAPTPIQLHNSTIQCASHRSQQQQHHHNNYNNYNCASIAIDAPDYDMDSITTASNNNNNYYNYGMHDYQRPSANSSQSSASDHLKNSFSSSSTSAASTAASNSNANANLCNSQSLANDMVIDQCAASRKSKSFNHYIINNYDHHPIHASNNNNSNKSNNSRKPSQPHRQFSLSGKSNIAARVKGDADNYSLSAASHHSSSTSSSVTLDLEQQTKIAYKYAQQLENQLMRLHDLRDTYLLHLKMGQSVRTISRAYALSSASLSSASLGKLTSSRTHLASALSNGTINSKIAKASIKEFMETIDKIELELESLMGTFMLQIRSIQGFARICSGDVFEITIKYGDNQKFKTKIRVLKGDKQKCDHKEAIFRARINDVLSVKASECKGLGKKVLLGNKLCETKDLFTAHSQLMTISLNQTGSIKLNLVVTWNPLDLSTNSICDANLHHMLNFFGDFNK